MKKFSLLALLTLSSGLSQAQDNWFTKPSTLIVSGSFFVTSYFFTLNTKRNAELKKAQSGSALSHCTEETGAQMTTAPNQPEQQRISESRGQETQAPAKLHMKNHNRVAYLQRIHNMTKVPALFGLGFLFAGLNKLFFKGS